MTIHAKPPEDDEFDRWAAAGGYSPTSGWCSPGSYPKPQSREERSAAIATVVLGLLATIIFLGMLVFSLPTLT
jgi:hypothetical protein